MRSPGQRVRSLIDQLELDQNKLAEKLNVARQTINYIVNDRQPISREMAKGLARLSGHTPGYWLQFEFEDEADGRSLSASAAVLVDEQIRQAVRDGILTIAPFDPERIQAASLDLTIGEIIVPGGQQLRSISSDRPYDLGPGEVVNLRTRETLRFPHDHLARVGAMASVSRFGIFMAHGLQVDPGYEGELEFCLFNAGVRTYPLVGGAPIISLEIVRLGATHSRATTVAPHDRSEVERHFDHDHPRASYPAFIARNAARLFLNQEEARQLASALGLAASDAFVTLRNGESVPLPQGMNEVSLETFAGQLGQTLDAAALALTRSVTQAQESSVARFRQREARSS